MAADPRAGNRIDRRRFLMGAGGAALALPMLREFAPRRARGADTTAPKRVVVVHHFHGRMVGTRQGEVWSPSASSGAFPASGQISPLLAGLGAVRDRFVTIDGIDDLVRHMTGNPDGHLSSNATATTCMPPTPDFIAGGPSFDYAAGELLRASSSQRPSIVFPASVAGNATYHSWPFYGPNGTQAYAVSTDPLESLVEVFGPPATDEPPPKKTLRDRLTGRRASILDGLAGEYVALSKQVGSDDRKQLEQHADFIRMVESHLGGTLTADCMRPSESAIPSFNAAGNSHGALDATITPWQIENLVMSLACDATRVAGLHFWQSSELATFPSAFDGNSPIPPEQLHTMIHDSDNPQSGSAQVIAQGFSEIGLLVAHLIARLGEVTDVDGAPLLDNTLVVWVSEMGYGSHLSHNIPVLLAGMPSAFSGGQGRHIVLPKRHSMGDLFTTVLGMVGVPDTTFGYQGKIGDSGVSQGNLAEWAGYYDGNEAFVRLDRPLHAGIIDV
jgi:hypothetical protein